MVGDTDAAWLGVALPLGVRVALGVEVSLALVVCVALWVDVSEPDCVGLEVGNWL